MSEPLIAIKKTLQHEGGYVNNPNDSGGETNMGITQADMPGQNMKELTVDQAISYYTHNYWKAFYSQIQSQDVADKIFDMSVLFGIGTAVRVLQIVLNIASDGVFGPGTLEAVNSAEPKSLLTAFKGGMVSHVFAIGNANPKDREFLGGWIRRINS